MAENLHRLRKGLIEGCNKAFIKDLLDDLLEEKILNDAEKEYIDEENTVSRDKMRDLIDIVRKKGDKSCNIMIQKVTIRNPDLSRKLGLTEYSYPTQETKVELPSQKKPSQFPSPSQELKVEPPSQTKCSFPRETNVDSHSQNNSNDITQCSQEEYERICSTEGNNKYKIWPKNERTRLALIICNDKFDDYNLDDRRGAEFDVIGMQKLLEGLGYKVLKETNLTVKEMRKKMKQFAAEPEHMTSDSTFLVFMSHGHRDVICATDTELLPKDELNNALHVDEIFTTFNNVNCRGLRDKPKVILIQACRGSNKSQVMVADSICKHSSVVQEDLEDDAMRMIQKERDFICFCSTTPDTVSWRSPKTGSLFILRLIEQMKKDAHRYSIEDIFRNVQLYFKDNVQMPTQERKTLLKKFYLFPGH